MGGGRRREETEEGAGAEVGVAFCLVWEGFSPDILGTR